MPSNRLNVYVGSSPLGGSNEASVCLPSFKAAVDFLTAGTDRKIHTLLVCLPKEEAKLLRHFVDKYLAFQKRPLRTIFL